MYCAHCDSRVPDDAAHCTACGRPVTRVATEPDRLTRALLPVGRSGLAIAAGYVGLFALVIFPLAPVAVGLGMLAVRDIRRSPGKHGMGRAIFAIVAGGIWILGLLLLVVVSVLGG